MKLTFPDLPYLRWAKNLPAVEINLARSGVEHCPPALLGLRLADVVTNLPVKYGYQPLKEMIAGRYQVGTDRVFTVSGGTTFSNWVACAAVLGHAPRGSEVLIEEPTYEQVLRLPDSFGARVRRFDRRFEDGFGIDLDKFARLVNKNTRLAIVTNLHNPTGIRIDPKILSEMSAILARVGAYLLVDEVYLECLFPATTVKTRGRIFSCVHTGANVITTNSLTKAYGLDGLRAGWILGPPDVIEHAIIVHNIVANNSVAPGERMTLAAFKHLRAINKRSHSLLDPNLERVRRFLAKEPRLTAHLPEGGSLVFPRVADGIDIDALVDHLCTHYSTLVVPGRFFGAPRHIRISFGLRPGRVARGLANISQALDDLAS